MTVGRSLAARAAPLGSLAGVRAKLKRAAALKYLYLLLVPPALHLLIFSYLPMYGVIIAFKDFKYAKGILGSDWTLVHFRRLFQDSFFWRAFRNTVIVSSYKIIAMFISPIVLALLLNEIRNLKFKKVVQTISYLPYFMSWIVLGGIIMELLSLERGAVNALIGLFGLKPINFLIVPRLFRPILVVSNVYASVGWSAVIYLAALSSVDPGLYEAAVMDGANRLQRALHISLPAIGSVTTIMFLLSLSGILNAGFDQVFILYNPIVYDVGDIIDTYVYRTGIQGGLYDFGAALGLLKNTIAIFLIWGTNRIVRRFSEYGIW